MVHRYPNAYDSLSPNLMTSLFSFPRWSRRAPPNTSVRACNKLGVNSPFPTTQNFLPLGPSSHSFPSFLPVPKHAHCTPPPLAASRPCAPSAAGGMGAQSSAWPSSSPARLRPSTAAHRPVGRDMCKNGRSGTDCSFHWCSRDWGPMCDGKPRMATDQMSAARGSTSGFTSSTLQNARTFSRPTLSRYCQTGMHKKPYLCRVIWVLRDTEAVEGQQLRVALGPVRDGHLAPRLHGIDGGGHKAPVLELDP